MKRSTTMLAVLLVLAGIGLYADRSCRGTDDVLRARTRLYPDFDRRRVQSITVGKEQLTGDRLESVIAELDFGRLERRIPAREPSMGLDTPRAVITVREIGGATHTFSIGADAPHGVYLSRDGEVFVIDRKLLELSSPSCTALDGSILDLGLPALP
jgi:hypothetical protein